MLTPRLYDFSGCLKQQQCDPLDFKCTSYCTICHCTNILEHHAMLQNYIKIEEKNYTVSDTLWQFKTAEV